MASPFPTTSPHAMFTPQAPLHAAALPAASPGAMLSGLVVSAEAQALIRRPKVLALTGWCKSTLANRVNAREFPAPVSTGDRTVAWVQAEVTAWVAARIRERDARLEKQQASQSQNAQDKRGAGA
ncbi:putative DNA-binding transcriptional regulator AlpA [Variovorax boronicumulans]|uniref:helix-turn-helix transcriptional regulator n=1 Tax=Variovorax boronicumulans TaxID=436515 RepID=UPI002782359B|nr:AlpA family phage regulatory protein [Variovorax boronicumulans]MDQ0017833.1 putative DNA-binding transcriptional regulator AlpA [Variovorax boronicumulans]